MMAIAPEAYRAMGLRDSEFSLICDLMGREPTYTELGMFAVMWSEHCGYKYSRPILSYFSKYKEALEGEGLENAGIIDIGDGLGITMKIESHNHPSAVEPYQGAATGVGGIIRDIFTMGARPIALGNSLRFGPIRDGEADPAIVDRNHYLVRHVVEGIGGYGNCVGVPTVCGEVGFHRRYSGNPLVNAMCVGVVPLDSIATAGAAGPGNPVLYMGSATGKDGIHGATFASEELSEDSNDRRPNVQIGDPFAEKLLIEATLEALETGAVVAIQDMGAAGLTCSTIEMSSKGGVGMEIDLDKVPMRESDMTGYELMLSESQERMLAVAHLGREQEVIDVCRKWGVPVSVIGTVTDSKRVRVFRHGKLEADVDATLLTDHCPTYTTDLEEPEYYREAQAFRLDSVPIRGLEVLPQLLASPNIASKQWVYEQYDHEVQTQTAVGPGAGDAAVMALRGTQKGIAIKIDGNSRWVYFDPYVGGQLAVAEAARNVACTGAMPRAITDGLNYGSPEAPHVYWQFERSVKGIADAAEVLNTPVISGNVSFYNQSDLGEVPPTPLIGMVGVLEDASKRIRMDLPADEPLELLVVCYPVRYTKHEGLGASEYLAEIHGIENGLPVPPDMEGERHLCEFLVQASKQQLILCAHDVSDGGLAVCLAEMAIPNKVGIEFSTEQVFSVQHLRSDSKIYGEFPGMVVLGVQAGKLGPCMQLADSKNLQIYRCGYSGQAQVAFVLDGESVNLEQLALAYSRIIPENIEVL
ncbi:MAG: phosphoribosylformylglycinamidine synthase subunit PurL [Armatimonadetes bacterium]|nr:phosphoribosylformylglycinamidine synthase subunit PurL [Armatimonadota bacterium]